MDEGVTNLSEHRDPGVDERQESVDRRRMPASRVKDPGTKLRRLRCFHEVEDMLREGRYLREIVTHIQDIRGELTDMSSRAVTYLVKDHKEAMFSGAMEDLDEPAAARGDSEDPLYVLYSQEKYYRLLEERIDMEVSTEKNLTKLFSTTHKEFLALQKVGEGILKRREQLGLLGSKQGGARQRVGSGTPGRVDVAEIIANPESRHKVMGFVEALVRDPDLLDSLSEETRASKTSSTPRKRRKRKNRK